MATHDFKALFQTMRYLFQTIVDANIDDNGHLIVVFQNGASQDLGKCTAYALAVSGGYTGTEELFASDLGNTATNADVAKYYAELIKQLYDSMSGYVSYVTNQLLTDDQQSTARTNIYAADNSLITELFIESLFLDLSSPAEVDDDTIVFDYNAIISNDTLSM